MPKWTIFLISSKVSIGCLIIIWTGLNIKIGIAQKIYTKWWSCSFAKMLPWWDNHFGKIPVKYRSLMILCDSPPLLHYFSWYQNHSLKNLSPFWNPGQIFLDHVLIKWGQTQNRDKFFKEWFWFINSRNGDNMGVNQSESLVLHRWVQSSLIMTVLQASLVVDVLKTVNYIIEFRSIFKSKFKII